MGRERLLSVVVLSILVLAGSVLSGCGGSGSKSSAPISVSVSASKAAVDQGQSVSVTATLTNDTSNQGVTWSVSCSASACGSVSPQTTTSGVATTFTAPVGAASDTITATSVADSTKTGTAAITVNADPAIAPPAGNALPAATVGVGYSYNLANLLSGGTSPSSWSVTSGTLPSGLSLASSGTITGTPTQPTVAGRQSGARLKYQAGGGPVSITFTVTDSGNPPQTATVTLSITVNPAPLAITTASLANGTVGTSYGPGGAGVTLAATGGIAPYTWSWSAQSGSSLPAGLSLAATTGTISGTPTAGGTFGVTVTVTDSETSPMTASANFSITISAPAALAIQTTTLGNGTVGTAFTASLSATGGVTPYTWNWAAQSGSSLPAGLSIVTNSDNTGTISGTPTTAGTYNVTVTVTDSESPAVSVNANFTITINATSSCTASQTSLCGQYAFSIQGYDSAGVYGFAGTFTTDGTNITVGVLDFNSFDGTATDVQIIVGSPSGFTIGSDGRGTLTLATSNSTVGSPTFRFAMRANGKQAFMIEFDDTTTNGAGRHGSGFMQLQDTTAFSPSAFSGNFAYGFVGGNASGGSIGVVGVMSASSTGCGLNSDGSTTTVNEAGTITSADSFTCTGSTGLPSISSTTGRGTVTFSYTSAVAGTSTLDYSFYAISATKLIFIVTDTPSGTSPVLGGLVKAQATPSGGFTSANVNCGGSGATDTGCIAAVSGAETNGTGAHVTAGVLTQPSAGSYQLVEDNNQAGSVSQKTFTGLTVTVTPQGTGRIGSGATYLFDFVLTGTDSGFGMFEDPGALFGPVSPQTVQTFATTAQTYALGSEYVGNTVVPNISGTITIAPPSSGSGTLTGTLDVEQIFASPFLIPGTSITGTYTMDTTVAGHATGTSTSPGPAQFTIWVINSGAFVLMETDSTNPNPVLIVCQQ